MTSFVYYKFKSQRDESRVSFNGTGISGFDLKREIILAKGLEKATDVDIVLLDPATEEEYADDHIIPRSSSVIVKRTPVRPGKSKTPRYLAGVNPSSSKNNHASGGVSRPANNHVSYLGPMTKRFDGKEEPKENEPAPLSSNVIQNDEAAALDAMFAAESENWNATQEKMSQQQRIYTAPRYGNRKLNSGGAPSRDTSATPGYKQQSNQQESRYHPYGERPIPQGYICFRCGQKGHWIQDCPTNKDKEWDSKPRLKRTTGIPRSFLKTVEATGETPVGPGVMITPEGKLVIAQPDNAAWEKQIYKSKVLTESDIRERPVTDSSLTCPLDNLLFRDAVRTPCCSTTYCEECIQNHLLDNDFTCPNCQSKISSLDRLVMDKPTRTRVMDYIDKAIAEGAIEQDDGEPAKRSREQRSASAEAQDQEAIFDQQPGGKENESGSLEDSNQQGYQENKTVEQIQAEISQLQSMLSNPRLPLHARNQAQMQLMQKQTLLSQAQTMSMLIAQAAAEASMNLPMPMPMVSMPMPMQMYNPAAMYGYGQQQQPVYNQSHGGNNWRGSPAPTASLTGSIYAPQPSDSDSAYQRLPVNNRRRPVKRERPSDFVEVSGQAYQ